MKKSEISPKFTIGDIHTIREDNYYNTKDMTDEEKLAYYHTLGKEAEDNFRKWKENN